jgi:hypothetical protein
MNIESSDFKDTYKEVSGSHFDIVIYTLDNLNKFFPNSYGCNFLHAFNSTIQTTFKRHQLLASTLDKS